MTPERAFLEASWQDFANVLPWIDWLLEHGEETRAKRLRTRWKQWQSKRKRICDDTLQQVATDTAACKSLVKHGFERDFDSAFARISQVRDMEHRACEQCADESFRNYLIRFHSYPGEFS